MNAQFKSKISAKPVLAETPMVPTMDGNENKKTIKITLSLNGCVEFVIDFLK